jgi:hypothetical protein
MADDFIISVLRQFMYYKSIGEKTIEQLTEDQLHFTPNQDSNSIAVIVKHLHGNMKSRWTDFLNSDGEKNWRQRDQEFEAEKISKSHLTELWNEGWTLLFNTIEQLEPKDLSLTVTIKQEQLLVIEAIHRQLAHYCYHIGQMVYIGKMLQGEQWINLSIPKK